MRNKYKPSVEEIMESTGFLSDATTGAVTIPQDNIDVNSNEGFIDNVVTKVKDYSGAYEETSKTLAGKAYGVLKEIHTLKETIASKQAMKEGAPPVTLKTEQIVSISTDAGTPTKASEFVTLLDKLQILFATLAKSCPKEQLTAFRLTIDDFKIVMKTPGSADSYLKKLNAAYQSKAMQRLLKNRRILDTDGVEHTMTSDVYLGGHFIDNGPYALINQSEEVVSAAKKTSYAVDAFTRDECLAILEVAQAVTEIIVNTSKEFMQGEVLAKQAEATEAEFVKYIRTNEVTDLPMDIKEQLARFHRSVRAGKLSIEYTWFMFAKSQLTGILTMVEVVRKSMNRMR